MRINNKKPALALVGTAVVAGVAAVAVQQAKQTQKRIAHSLERWHPITINRDVADVTLESEELQPLLTHGSSIELQISPAPGKKGTEIAGRVIRDGLSAREARNMLAKLRTALRDTQWLFETGEVLKADEPPSTHRTLTGLPLDFVTRHAKEGGRL
ncbi:MAG: hypothetical protein JWM37_678 [Candidatus Saccharibacteria bacterium]|nr:hypothetical protein [Candidatus Saccharibacteria bacterium]